MRQISLLITATLLSIIGCSNNDVTSHHESLTPFEFVVSSVVYDEYNNQLIISTDDYPDMYFLSKFVTIDDENILVYVNSSEVNVEKYLTVITLYRLETNKVFREIKEEDVVY